MSQDLPGFSSLSLGFYELLVERGKRSLRIREREGGETKVIEELTKA